MERLQQVTESAGVEKMLTVKAVPYAVAILAAVVVVVKSLQNRRERPKTWFKSRPRSPDPEKPTDLNTFAEKRMKATERPPGSMSPS